MRTDIVALANSPLFINQMQSTHMIFYMNPVAHLITLPINGQRPSSKRLLDHKRDELFWILIRSVIINAMCDDAWNLIGTMPSLNQMIATGFTGRIRRTGQVNSVFL